MQRRYLVDIPHPHFVHFFRNIILLLGRENVIITCQKSGIITQLLDNYGLRYIELGQKYNNLISKAYGQLRYFVKYLKIIRRYNIDFLLGMSPSVALAAKISGRKLFFFDDDDSAVQPLTRKITIPLADYIITPQCLEFENYGTKHFTYRGYQELAYLAPTYFKPEKSVITKYGLIPDSYFILRFNDFHAHHDLGHSGIQEQIKDKLIELLSTFGSVYITSEGELHEKYSKYQLRVKPEDIHHVLAFARMYIGDSQTMTSEAAVLGIPAIRCNTFKNKIAYLKELEETYQLTYAFLPSESEELIDKVKALIAQDNLKETWISKRNTMLSEMEDVNKYILKILHFESSPIIG